MSEQPPVQPPGKSSKQPSNPPGASGQPAAGNPPTQPMPAPESTPPAGSAAGPAASAAGPAASAGGPTVSPAGPPNPPSGPPAGPAPSDAPQPNIWRRATSSTGRRVALGLSAFALVCLLMLGFGIAAVALLRHDDRMDLVGNRQDRQSLRQDGRGNGPGDGRGLRDGNRNGDGNGNGKEKRVLPRLPAAPGNPGGRGQNPNGLGNLPNIGGLHGTVTATIDGSVQSVVFQRGEVTAVSATSITLKSTDGFVGTYGRNASTKVNGVAPVKGGQAWVLARASDKVSLRIIATRAKPAVSPSN